MKNKFFLLIIGAAALGLASLGATVQAGSGFHDPPFDFLFGNHIDTHQETNLKINNKTGDPESLFGKFYIIFTGDTDPVSGLPVARHPRGADHGEECGFDDVDCVTGWEIRGVPGAAKFVSHSGVNGNDPMKGDDQVNGNDHPLWLVNRAEEEFAPAEGMVIPQPGSFTHFHWITYSSNDPRADPYDNNIPLECNKSNAGELQNTAPSAVDVVCPGWFMQIKALRKFAFKHGGEIIPVRPGMDNRSHLNLITNFNNGVTITDTR